MTKNRNNDINLTSWSNLSNIQKKKKCLLHTFKIVKFAIIQVSYGENIYMDGTVYIQFSLIHKIGNVVNFVLLRSEG